MLFLVALLIATSAYASLDSRLFGTWRGIDPQSEEEIVLDFAEDGTLIMSATAPDDDVFGDLFDDMLNDLDLSPDSLDALGFKLPVIERVAIIARWEAEQDSVTVWMTDIQLFYVEGNEYTILEFMENVLVAVIDLGVDEEMRTALQFIIDILPTAYGASGDEWLLFTEHYYFDGERLVVEDSEIGTPLFLDRLIGAGAETATQAQSWGQIKSLVGSE